MTQSVKNLIKDALIRGEMLAALSAVALMASISLIFKVAITWDFVVIVLLLSVAVYFFDFFDDATDFNFTQNSEETIVKKDKKYFKFITFILIIICLPIAYIFSSIWSLLYLIMLISLGILYPLYFKKLTKKIVGFKDFYVALSWVIFELFFFVYYSYDEKFVILFFLLFMFTRDFMGASYCDIKDIGLDKKNKLLTLASTLGKNNLVSALSVINILSLIVLFIGLVFNILPQAMTILFLPILITMLLIYIAKNKDEFPSYYIDLEYCIWFLILFFSTNV